MPIWRLRMRFFLLAVALSLESTAAHGVPSPPQLLGGRELFHGFNTRGEEGLMRTMAARRNDDIHPRQATCGAGVGSCAEGFCCSSAGQCGQSEDFCKAGCQLSYGPACDGNKPPAQGANTSAVARPALGSVAYGGVGIHNCTVPGNVAVTYDDGPLAYTNDLLDKLKGYGARATFFVVGNNGGNGPINDPNKQWRSVIKRMADEGHQIASHTWTHEDSTNLNEAQVTNQMVYNEMAINDILGYFPTYMRPPYSACGDACAAVMARLGYHVVYFDVNTLDYANDAPGLIQNSKDAWDRAVGGSDPAAQSFLSLEHDIHEQTVYNLTDYIMNSLQSKGYRAVTVGECLGDPKENWYRQGPSTPST